MSTYVTPARTTLRTVITDLITRVRRLEAIPPPKAVFEIKLFADAIWPDAVALVVAGDGRFVFAIPSDIDLWYLSDVEAYVSTVGSGDISLQLRRVNGNVDLLVDPVVIPAGDTTSCGQDYEIDTDTWQVEACELISVDVDAAGGGDAKGLGVTIMFKQGPVPAST